MTGLYVHIPFCVRKCHYCNFVIAPSENTRQRADYLTALELEAAESRRRYGPFVFDTVYFGGGTPSALSVAEMDRVFETLRKNFSWKPDAEITVEVNPGEVDVEKFKAYRRLGVNRISLGVQSTNDDLLKAMNRAHSAADAERTARLAQTLGFANISMDMIIRLPNQKMVDVANTIDKMVEWNAHQIVVYDLTVHENTQFGTDQRKGNLTLPPEIEHEAMFKLVEEKLGKAGFEHYEVLSFAKPGFESKHNSIYWHNQPYLGLGPGAFSYISDVRWMYASTVSRYLEKALRGDWTRDEEDILGPEDRAMETFLTGLRLKKGVAWPQEPRVRSRVTAKMPELTAQGLVESDDARIYLTRKGRYLAESVFGKFAEKADAGAGDFGL